MQMSAKILGRVWDLDLPHNKLLVLLALADHADHEGNNVFPSLGLVAWKTGYSQQQCRRVMSELEKDGILIAIQRRPGFKTIYRIDVNKGIQKEPYTPSKMSPLPKSEDNPLHFDHTTPNMTSLKNDAEPSSLEPSKETNTPHKRGERPQDLIFNAIKDVFQLKAPGQIIAMREMMLGRAKRGTWKDCNFEPPVTDPQEITDFGVYMRGRILDMNRKNKEKGDPMRVENISAAVTIQRWFYDFRAARDAEHPVKAAEPTEAELKLRTKAKQTDEDFARWMQEQEGMPTP